MAPLAAAAAAIWGAQVALSPRLALLVHGARGGSGGFRIASAPPPPRPAELKEAPGVPPWGVYLDPGETAPRGTSGVEVDHPARGGPRAVTPGQGEGSTDQDIELQGIASLGKTGYVLC